MELASPGYPNFVSGSCVVLLTDNTPVRVIDLVGLHGSTTKTLLGPTGPVEVDLKFSSPSDNMPVTLMRDDLGRGRKFCLSSSILRIDEQHVMNYSVGNVFRGFKIKDGHRVLTNLTVESVRVENRFFYPYHIRADLPLFIGAGKNPIFLPFEVRYERNLCA